MKLQLCYCNTERRVVAISGVKNSGKTTLITKLIPILNDRGYQVATIKHDGHEFEGDVEGTDTYQHTKAGAYGTAIFSNGKFMVKKKQTVTEKELMDFFPEADMIILEGFKYSQYPKIEIIRSGNSNESVCNRNELLAIVTDTKLTLPGIKKIEINDIVAVADCIIEYVKGKR